MNLVNESWLWHRRLGHINFDNLVKVSNIGEVINLPNITNPSNPICRHCQLGNKNRVRFKKKERSTSKPFELVHTDLDGPIRNKSMQVKSYFMLFIDDFTRMDWVFFSQGKIRSI